MGQKSLFDLEETKLTKTDNNLRAFVGLDIALNFTGISINWEKEGQFINGNLELIESEKITGSEKKIDNNVDRLIEIIDYVYSKADEMLVFIEDYPIGRFMGNLAERIETIGIVKRYLRRLNIPHKVVNPMSLKVWITGSGKSDKGLVRMDTKKYFGREIRQPDQCDAYCLSRLAHLYWAIENDRDTGKMYLTRMHNKTKELIKKWKTVKRTVRKKKGEKNGK